MPIGAISIAPLLLLKAGMPDGKPFWAGVNPSDLEEEEFTSKDLALMTGWDDSIKNPDPEAYIRSGNIVASVSCGFVRWAPAFRELLGNKLFPKSFGL